MNAAARCATAAGLGVILLLCLCQGVSSVPAGASCCLILPGLALIWDGGLHPSQMCVEQGVGAEFIRLGDSSMGDAAPLGVPALCHCWSPPLPILPPLDLTPVISSSMAVFKGLSHIFPSSSHALVSVAVCGSAFQH